MAAAKIHPPPSMLPCRASIVYVHGLVDNCLYACKEGFEIEVPVDYGKTAASMQRADGQHTKVKTKNLLFS
jgi:hypothetical protein